ncbi:hypothetical protein BGZ94_006203 [Podila epigama]|nr:hypothetical protein BGZ94_006203 [Podila epigama]
MSVFNAGPALSAKCEDVFGHTAAQSSSLLSPTTTTTTTTILTSSQVEEPHDRTIPTNLPAPSPSIARSTVVVTSPTEPADTTVTAVVEPGPSLTVSSSEVNGHIVHGESVLDSVTMTSQHPSQISSSWSSPPPITNVHQTTRSKPTPTPSASIAPPQQPERHIPSYEQWRKQVLEKKAKPYDPQERKQRKRKPYQESSVDVALGGEEELGFDLESGNNINGKVSDQFQHLSKQFGGGPDLKKAFPADQDWIKSEYAKDPKDRFNHASATCAASVVKASKDATSITAILNEGKDNYMLNKCSTKEKFFVVELCEEILVDSFVLGNYEFFSSTFKDFVVSVNRYPPRDDGWAVLGHFRARNTRDAQVFKPATPRLATYIRFDFISHYGNEYYCPVTLLRVYGATALEQLKQEEEEEKRLAMEEAKRAELERAKLAAEEAEDAGDDDDDEADQETEESGKKDTDISDTSVPLEDMTTAPAETVNVNENEAPQMTIPDPTPNETASPTPTVDSMPSIESNNLDAPHGADSPELFQSEEASMLWTDPDAHDAFSDSPENDLAFIPEWPSETEKVPPIDIAPSAPLLAEETLTPPASMPSSNVIPPLPSTSPAAMQDDSDWQNVDLGIITLSQKARPTHLTRHPGAAKGSVSGMGTPGSASATEPGSPHPIPSPGHSSQESVYKNIVNRLKALELNSSLSYLYLEEQSNIFNEVIDSSTQKINQLVNHLNEANRRLELLGRKYDQLSYSYRAHVEIDGEKRRKEFQNLSNQVHVLGSQVLFQRHVFVITVITIIAAFAFTTLTKSSTMHYAIHQSPLSAKLRAISGQRRVTGSNDISTTVRIGSVENLANFGQNTQQGQQHIYSNEPGRSDQEEDCKLAPPISPMSPLSPNPIHSGSTLMNETHHGQAARVPERTASDRAQRSNDTTLGVGAEDNMSPELRSQDREGLVEPADAARLEALSRPPFEHVLVTRTPFPTPKESYVGIINTSPHSTRVQQQQTLPQSYSLEYRPESPVFQGPSINNDADQLSDADVAYISRDMNVGRMSSSGSSLPTTPTMKRLSVSYYNQFHHHHHPHHNYQPHASGATRPASSLRMDTTSSMTPRPDSDDSEQAAQSPDTQNSRRQRSPEEIESSPMEQEPEIAIENQSTRTDGRPYRFPESEDVGFVSDSALDSASENTAGSREIHLEGWDRYHGNGESTRVSTGDDIEESNQAVISLDTSLVEPIKESNGHVADTKTGSLKERPKYSREGSKTSRRRNSHSIQRPQDLTSGLQIHKNHSASATLGLGVGLGLEQGDETSPNQLQPQHADFVGRDIDQDNHNTAIVPGELPPPSSSSSSSPSTERTTDVAATAATDIAPETTSKSIKKKRSKRLLEDQIVPRRKGSFERHSFYESTKGNKGSAEGGGEDDLDLGQEGDDERSPQVSRKTTT